jgi:predicted nucleotidyltransferase
MISEEQIVAFCRKWGIRELAVFGSVLRPDFGPESDIDFLVTFREGRKPEWPRFLDMQEELSALVGRPADIVDRRNVERSENYIKRKHILQSAQVLYVER